MNETSETKAPRARKDQLIVKEVRDEVLVYDLKTNKAHCLNDTAARVWKECDGRRSVSDIARVIERDLNSPVDDQVVWLAMAQLEKFKLLKHGALRPAGQPQISRRALIRAGISSAVLLPLIFTISAPNAFAQGSKITPAVCATLKHNAGIGCGGASCTTPGGTTCVKVGAPADPCGCA